jgi:B12-binding domain/radical SAM domain protein
MSLLDFAKIDVLFLHAPSVYDFRKGTVLFGPISDVVPSSSVFEMYPIGITSIADRLEHAGYHVQVINVAYRMLNDPDYDPEEVIRRQHPRLWAIDLHWLPHAQGALALADLIKKHHPKAPVLLGGLSASYFHEELVKRPSVDFVVRGDSTEWPVLALVESLRLGRGLEEVPNLTWKDQAGSVHANPLSYVPDSIDDQDLPGYRYTMRSVFKYWNLDNIIPYVRWLDHPMTALLTARGCTLNCAICGGSKSAYQRICGRSRPVFRSPERLARDVRFIRRFSRAPIFVIHDIRMGGMAYTRRLLELFKDQNIDNEMVFELFGPADSEFFEALQAAVPNYSLELTIESHDPELRKLNGKFAVSNARVEATIAAALDHGCQRLDIFFMVGLPFQSPKSALDSIEYSRKLYATFLGDRRIQVYIAPLAPFLDPGSRAFEDPEAFGYRLRAHSLEDHRQRLDNPLWSEIMNYESTSMPPDLLAEATYEAVDRLSRLKGELGLQSAAVSKRTARLIEEARHLTAAITAAQSLPEVERRKAFDQLQAEARRSNGHRLYDQEAFVSWGGRRWLFRPLGLLRLMVALFLEELTHAVIRLRRGTYRWEERAGRRGGQRPTASPRPSEAQSGSAD